jgi:GT2 family glycosyltransferase
MRQNYPQVEILHNSQNLGFAGGCNRGIEEALLRKADYVLLLNNDAALDANTLSLMVEEAESDPHIGVVAPAVWRTDAPELLDSAYGVILFNHVIARRLGVSREKGLGYMTARDVDCVFGAVLLVRSEVFRATGLFDPEFWMFLEEVEFCYRARKAGFRIRYFPAASAHHLAGYSIRTSRIELLKIYLLRRNSVLFLRKHGTPARWCNFLVSVVLSLIFSFVTGMAQLRWEGFAARLRGYADGFARRLLNPEELMRRYSQGR